MARINEDKARTLKESASAMVAAGHIQKFSDLFVYIGKTPFSQMIGLSYQTYLRREKDPTTFTVGEILKTALVLGIDRQVVVNLILAEIDSQSKKKR